MPELPEVETTKKSLQPIINATVKSVRLYQPKLRWVIPSDIDSLAGYTLNNIKRRAKYLILSFSKNGTEKSIIAHLGMSGSLQQYPMGKDKRTHDHLIMDFTSSTGDMIQLHYHDPRRFGAVLWADKVDDEGKTYRQRLLAHLGVEPLQDEFTADYLYRFIHRIDAQGRPISNRSKPISRAVKSVIMEQKVVVGVGNIYATESLFMSGIHPLMAANKLTKSQIFELVGHIKSILARAIEKGSSTLKDFTVGGGTTGYFQQRLLVYGHDKEPCPQCGTIIENVKINARASTYCPQCQPMDYS